MRASLAEAELQVCVMEPPGKHLHPDDRVMKDKDTLHYDAEDTTLTLPWESDALGFYVCQLMLFVMF